VILGILGLTVIAGELALGCSVIRGWRAGARGDSGGLEGGWAVV